jgi:phage terminase large subunit GpA-like protein
MTEIKFDDIRTSRELRDRVYFYVIHGTFPEIEPSVAYRRIGAEAQHRRKILKCPYCQSRLTDMDIDTNVELYGHAERVAVKCQFYMRCAHCHREVGINVA